MSMRVFRRVVERASFAAAARDLRLSNAAVSKHVAALEESLGTKLLHRTTRKVTPTPVGASYVERCARVLDEIDELDQSVSRAAATPVGLLRVNVPVSFGLLHVTPLLPELLDEHPGLRLEISYSDRFVDLLEEQVDLAIRVARSLPDSASLVAQALGRTAHVVCASPAYVQRFGSPGQPEDLAAHACVTYALSTAPHTWSFDGPRGTQQVDVGGRLALGNSLAVREVVLAGAGIALLPAFYVSEEVRQGRLLALLQGFSPRPATVHASYPRAKFGSAKVRAFVDHLRKRFARASWNLR